MPLPFPTRIVGLALFTAVCGASALAQTPTRVGVVIAQKKEIGREFSGRVVAREKVEIRARVKGFLKAVKFTEGQAVMAGDPLYEIEPDLFNADVNQAQGALARAEASKALAELQLKRAQELMSRQLGTTVQRDQAVASDQEAAGAILSAKTNLDIARINLGFTTIAAPIKGRIGMTLVTSGNLVGPDTGPLATILNQDPVHVTFPVNQREFLGLGDVRTTGVALTLSDGAPYGEKGRIDFVDNAVNTAADTIILRAIFPNPQERLRDGQPVRVRLDSDRPRTMVTAPRSAVLADKDGAFVFIVEDGKAIPRRIKTTGDTGDDALVAEGLSGGEKVMIEGLSNVRPGAPVEAAPVAKGGS